MNYSYTESSVYCNKWVTYCDLYECYKQTTSYETLYFNTWNMVEFTNNSLLESSPILYGKTLIIQFLLDSINVSELLYLIFTTLQTMIKFVIKYL